MKLKVARLMKFLEAAIKENPDVANYELVVREGTEKHHAVDFGTNSLSREFFFETSTRKETGLKFTKSVRRPKKVT